MVLLFGTTLFVSATLLFLVQPMVGKMILPSLGGAPAVWSTCMVFFQGVLLAGYAYAHGSVFWLGVRRQAALHLALLVVPWLVLPISMSTDLTPPAEENPVFWLLWRLLVSVGLPFFVVSSSAPLLQKWFAHTRHHSAKDPYFLYAASNVGSLSALLAYPLLVEPSFGLANQSWIWAVSYGVLIAMTLTCAIVLWRCPPVTEAVPASEPSGVRTVLRESGALSAVVTFWQRMRWVALAMVPSSLMLGVTAHITTNLAVVPLLWVVPLAIYLLTFVLVFARKPPLRHAWMVRFLPFVVLPMGMLVFADLTWLAIPAHLLMFFVVAMASHGELARRRPSTTHLTEFYLWMSVGGVLGGLFNAIVAPLAFDTVLEYPLMLVVACVLVCRTATRPERPRDRWLDFAYPAGLAVVATGIVFALQMTPFKGTRAAVALLFIALVMLCFVLKDRPIRFGLSFAVVLVTVGLYTNAQDGTQLHVGRNFFGVKKVIVAPEGTVRMLVHGNTNHGSQSTDPARSLEPLAYHHRSGPIGDVFKALGKTHIGRRVAVIGLGAGAIACYADPGQEFTFYEIDPAVERLARDSRYFTFLRDCRGTTRVVLGDGRLMIARAPHGHYGIIVVDVFSSDAIPTHLLSREAIQLYFSRLAEDGVVALNISNRYLDFEPLLANMSKDAHLTCLIRGDTALTDEERASGKLPSQWLVMARKVGDVAALADNPRWRRASGRPDTPVWTDQYCSILKLFRREKRPVLARKD